MEQPEIRKTSLIMPEEMRRATEYSPRAPEGPRFYTRPPHSSNLRRYVDKAQVGLGVEICLSAVPKDEAKGQPYGCFWGPRTGDHATDAALEARIIKYYGLDFEVDVALASKTLTEERRGDTPNQGDVDDRPSLDPASEIRGSGNRPDYPLARMTKVGDSFVVTGRDVKHMKSCVATFLRSRGLLDVAKFAYHEVPAGVLIVALETVDNEPRYLVKKKEKKS